MKDKNKLMRKLILGGATFGYFVLSYASLNIQLIFCIFASVATIVYLFESIKNKYGKTHIILSIGMIIVYLHLMIFMLIKNKWTNLIKYQRYALIFPTIFILGVIIAGLLNHIKNGDKSERKISIMVLIFFTILITIIILAIILREYGII